MSEVIMIILWTIIVCCLVGIHSSYFTLEFINAKSIRRQIYKELSIQLIIIIFCTIASFINYYKGDWQ